MSKLAEAIVGLIRGVSAGRRLRVGITCRGYPSVAARIAGEGHPTLIIGDRFRPLFKAHQKASRSDTSQVIAVEATLRSVPIERRSLDALVLLPGLPDLGHPLETLATLRELLADDGLLAWPHTSFTGLPNLVSRKLVPRQGTISVGRRVDLTALVMEAGFREVGQLIVPRRLGSWIVTSGRSGPRRWER